MGLQIRVLNASTSPEIDAAFATFVREPPDGLVVGGDTFFLSRRVFGARLCRSRRLTSYGSNVTDAFHQVGVYAGRILKGDKPADLPVVQTRKFELVFNAQTARTLGLTVPPTLLARADEVIQ